MGGNEHAGRWSSVANSWVDMHPAGATRSSARDASGSNQVGYAYVGGNDHAGLWSGTAGSWVDLHPAGATKSYAYGASGANQAGYADVGSTDHASLWSGTSASWVDLHPAGATDSYAWGISGGNQVGYATVGGADHASLWSGTAASWVDLHPAGATDSYAWDISGANQVGRARVGGVDHASLWSGSAASWVDLHPVGAASSHAVGASGANQVGHATVGGVIRACFWSGTAASWVDLHAFLPSGFTESYATAISTDGVYDYVTGYGLNSATSHYEALLWRRFASFPVGFTITPDPMAGGGVATATVTLSRPALIGGAVVTISENTSYLSCPSSVTVPAGQTSATFPVTTYNPPSTVTKWVTVSQNSISLDASITLTPLWMTGFTVTPTSFLGGPNISGTITLSAPAPPGFRVLISDNSLAIGSPAPIAFVPGATSTTFAIATYPTATTTTATISARKSTQTLSQTVTINRPVLNYLALSSTSLIGGNPLNATPQLTGQAYAGGITVAMSSSGTELVPPAAVLIPYRNTQKTVAVNTTPVASTVSRTLSATFSGVTKTRSITIRP